LQAITSSPNATTRPDTAVPSSVWARSRHGHFKKAQISPPQETTTWRNADNVRLSNSPKYSIGTKLRETLPESAEFPAPGAYSIDRGDAVISCASPKYSIGSRLRTRLPESADFPAPGYYNVEKGETVIRSSSPKYTMGSKPRETLPENVDFPAPGTYDPTRSDAVIYSSSPKYSVSCRFTEKPPESIMFPGPGDYCPDVSDHVVKMRPPHYSFGCKLKPPRPYSAEYPASCTYSPEHSTKAVRTSAPKFTFGSKISDASPERHLYPGPADYDPVKGREYVSRRAPRYSFRSRLKERPPDNLQFPAPGSYDPDRGNPALFGSLPTRSKSRSPRRTRSHERDDRNGTETEDKSAGEMRRSRSLRIVRSVKDQELSGKENISKSEGHIASRQRNVTFQQPRERKCRSKRTDISVEKATNKGTCLKQSVVDGSLTKRTTLLETSMDAPKRHLSPESKIRNIVSPPRTIKMAPRSPDGVEFWKPPGAGPFYARLHQSGDPSSAVSPAEAEDNSKVTFESGASLLSREGFAGPSRDQTFGSEYYDTSVCEKLRFSHCPSFPMRGKTKMPKEPTPAPGDYDPEKADPWVRPVSPSYSFGLKISCQPSCDLP
ncbi:uncharacterized protein ISCGN_020487, partial [Ixodes scapularis]